MIELDGWYFDPWAITAIEQHHFLPSCWVHTSAGVKHWLENKSARSVAAKVMQGRKENPRGPQ